MVNPNQPSVECKSLQNVKSDYRNKILRSSQDCLNLQVIESLFSDNPQFLRKVYMLHFIIMYYNKSHIQFYLENITSELGIITTNLIVNYPVDFNLINTKSANVILDNPEYGISPGQACVFYKSDENGERCLGGGWIN